MASHAAESPNGMQPGIQDGLVALNDNEKTMQDQLQELSRQQESLMQALEKADETDSWSIGAEAEKQAQTSEKSEQAPQAEKEQLKKQLEDREQEANHELRENKLMELEQKAEKEQLKKQLEDREQEAKTKEAASQAQLELLKNELREAQQAQQKARLRDAEKEATDEACARRAEEHTRKVQESEEALTKRADVAENTRESHKVNFDFAQMELPAEKQKWLTEVKRNGQNLQKAPEHLKNDKDVVLAAVEEHRLALQHASEELKKNKDVVTAAVEKDPRAFTFASEELKKDISFVKTVVQLKPKALEFAADALKQNKDVVLVAVQHSGSALQHAAEALQSDQEVVMAAVQQNGEALQYAAAAFKAEKEVVMAAVQQNGEALQYAAAAFSAEKEVVMAAVQQNGKALQFAAATLKTDKELVQAAWLQRVLRDGTEMQHAPWILRNNREFLIKAVAATRAPWLLKLSSEALKQDKELSEHLKALAGTGLVFTYYHSFDCFHNMREAFLATGASAPGGQAYEEVMKKLNETSGGSATVWFDKVHVWGFAAGHWRHPSTDCGRDMVPVPPPEGRDPMWEAMVESRIERLTPEVGSQHPCWCCRWLRVVKEKIEAGAVICCVVSNIYDDSWVDDYGAGSSEVSDRVAEHYGLKRSLAFARICRYAFDRFKRGMLMLHCQPSGPEEFLKTFQQLLQVSAQKLAAGQRTRLQWKSGTAWRLSAGRYAGLGEETRMRSHLRLKLAVSMGCSSSKATVHPLSSKHEASSALGTQVEVSSSQLRTSAAQSSSRHEPRQDRQARELPSADQKVHEDMSVK
eukprot:g21062.t1